MKSRVVNLTIEKYIWNCSFSTWLKAMLCLESESFQRLGWVGSLSSSLIPFFMCTYVAVSMGKGATLCAPLLSLCVCAGSSIPEAEDQEVYQGGWFRDISGGVSQGMYIRKRHLEGALLWERRPWSECTGRMLQCLHNAPYALHIHNLNYNKIYRFMLKSPR